MKIEEKKPSALYLVPQIGTRRVCMNSKMGVRWVLQIKLTNMWKWTNQNKKVVSTFGAKLSLILALNSTLITRPKLGGKSPHLLLSHIVSLATQGRGWRSMVAWQAHFLYLLLKIVTTLTLGLRPTQGLARVYKGVGQEGSSEVTSHALESVGKCEGMNPHTPKWTPTLRIGIPMDSSIFREQL
jgi:hypothetical protein